MTEEFILGFLFGGIAIFSYCLVIDYFTNIKKLTKLHKEGKLETKKWSYTCQPK